MSPQINSSVYLCTNVYIVGTYIYCMFIPLSYAKDTWGAPFPDRNINQSAKAIQLHVRIKYVRMLVGNIEKKSCKTCGQY